ncbi:hypothetical protein VHA_003540 [Grimontia hollisae CIP 101886]|uniref:Uncharacterized protein n=1 Tax=Grimontia hollisae CIP 101886 TaxID=675812 RepID=D0ICR1_GRIHO|nr:hypothetical protein VHA_003540 [Grimontia hollisae CIP 101886]
MVKETGGFVGQSCRQFFSYRRGEKTSMSIWNGTELGFYRAQNAGMAVAKAGYGCASAAIEIVVAFIVKEKYAIPARDCGQY